jgi:hypothetical protein
MRMKNIIKTVAMGAILAVSGFARAGEVMEPAVMGEPWEFSHGGMAGPWSIGKLTTKKKNPERNGFDDATRSDVRLSRHVDVADIEKIKTKYSVVAEKDEKAIDAEIKEIVKKVTTVTKGQSISDIMHEKSWYYPADWEISKEEHGYLYFEFKKYKVNVKNEDDRMEERSCTALVTYRDEGAIVKKDADGKVIESDRPAPTAENPAHLSVKTYLIDTTKGNSGIILMQDKDGVWSKLHDN